jgi:hypothetical protein
VRLLVLPWLLVLAGCPAALEGRSAAEPYTAEDGVGGGLSACRSDTDCIPAGPKCCDCPTHAVAIDDPEQRACSDVDCPLASCPGNPLRAACELGRCVLVCAPVTSDRSCADGFATDLTGCLADACAAIDSRECTADGECVRVDADCCGCEMGGSDAAVPVGAVAAFEAALECGPSPACPTVDTCAPDLAARCVQGACTLISGGLPADACGRPDLPPCASGTVCTLNVDAQATAHGVGVCR